MYGLDWYDYEARMYDSALGRFMVMDPSAEKYYSISPYAYCINNPIRLIDPNGKEIIITGALSGEALRQLQEKSGKNISLSINDKGKVGYVSNTKKKLKGDAKRISKMIDDNSITVNLITTDKYETSTGNLLVGGAFMGNSVRKDANGNTNVIANQEINPNVLGKADEHTRTPGKMIMHEITEAYAGAQISKKMGIGASQATKAEENNPSSVYFRAHHKATPQSPVQQELFDSSGNKTYDVMQAVRVEWTVSRRGKKKIIQTYP